MPRKEISFCPIEFKIRPILDSFRPKEFNMLLRGALTQAFNFRLIQG